MAKKEAPVAESTAQFANRVFTELQQTILAHEAGALAGDVEAIHDMRVTVRRLRVALSNFAACLDKDEHRKQRHRLSNLADALGAVRDLDVSGAALQTDQVQANVDEQLAITALLRRVRAQRRLCQRQLIAYLRGAEYQDFKQQISAAPPHAEEQHGQAA
jgi:CHAD domain-containing protein